MICVVDYRWFVSANSFIILVEIINVHFKKIHQDPTTGILENISVYIQFYINTCLEPSLLTQQYLSMPTTPSFLAAFDIHWKYIPLKVDTTIYLTHFLLEGRHMSSSLLKTKLKYSKGYVRAKSLTIMTKSKTKAAFIQMIFSLSHNPQNCFLFHSFMNHTSPKSLFVRFFYQPYQSQIIRI